MSIIRTDSLAVGYGSKVVVDQVNLEALKGQIVCLLGPNGSGKTTILRTLAGFLSPLKGSILLKGQEFSGIDQRKLAKLLAVVLTDRPAPGLITVFEVAAMGRYPHTGFFGRLTTKDIKITMEALSMVNAENLAQRYFSELSDGEKQKVMIARAIVQEPELIILDEPTIHLDVKHKLEVISILKQMSQEKQITVILSLHEIDLALKSSDTVILVKDGKIMDYGCPEDVLSGEVIEKLYDIDMAHYSDQLGTIELCNQAKNLAFILGGGGSGSRLYRALNKHGYEILTGIVHQSDLDYFVAKSIGASIISEKPFEIIRKETYAAALNTLKKVDTVIDAGFVIGKSNERNLVLLVEAVRMKKSIYSLRQEKETRKLFQQLSADQYIERIIFCQDIADIVKKITLGK